MDELDRDELVERQVPSRPDRAHAALPEEPLDAIAPRDDLPLVVGALESGFGHVGRAERSLPCGILPRATAVWVIGGLRPPPQLAKPSYAGPRPQRRKPPFRGQPRTCHTRRSDAP